MAGSHSVLNASGSHRWIHCTPSVRFSEDVPEKSSEYAEEGSLAHELCAQKLAEAFDVYAAPLSREPEVYDAQMHECADVWVNLIRDCAHPGKHNTFIEQRVDYSSFIGVPESYGTADCIVLDGTTCWVFDFKYGMGVPVDAENNSQLMLYALGALNAFDLLYNIKTFAMVICQPRVREKAQMFTMTREELLRVAETEFRPAALMAIEGKGEFHSGEWCRFCRAKGKCRAYAEQAESVIAAAEKALYPPELTDTEITEPRPLQ